MQHHNVSGAASSSLIKEKGSAGSNNIWLFIIMEKVKRYMILAAHAHLCEGKAAY